MLSECYHDVGPEWTIELLKTEKSYQGTFEILLTGRSAITYNLVSFAILLDKTTYHSV